MRLCRLADLLAVWFVLTACVYGADLHVAPGGAHVPPFDSWGHAAHDIQSAIDAASAGDTVWVSNGLYNTGGRVLPAASLTNRIVIDKPITVLSVNGWRHTTIAGSYDPSMTNGPAAVRCVAIVSNASLSGFLVISGATVAIATGPYDNRAGGLLLSAGVVSNCVIRDCLAAPSYAGGGIAALSGTAAYNCLLTGNRAFAGGGAYNARLINCTIISNMAVATGGGTFGGQMVNCINTGNGSLTARVESNWHGGSHTYSHSSPCPPGEGNVTNAPYLQWVDVPRPLPGSSTVNAGTNEDWMVGGTDLLGSLRLIDTVDLGAVEFNPLMQTGAFGVALQCVTQAGVNASIRFSCAFTGLLASSVWDLGDGTMVSNAYVLWHSYTSTGRYDVVLRAANQDGVVTAAASVLVRAEAVVHVAMSGNDAHDGLSWAFPKLTIQAAIDVCPSGGVVLVTNGTYGLGGRVAGGALTNRVLVERGIAVRSVNGPAVTFISGRRATNAPGYADAARGVYLAAGTSLTGFTVTNGWTLATNSPAGDGCGGGVWCESAEAVLSNCIVVANHASTFGGGVYGGLLRSCVLAANVASNAGGGAAASRLVNCSVLGNSALQGGGTISATNLNTILYYNAATNGANYLDSALDYCCAAPSAPGIGNITSPPRVCSHAWPTLFEDSPCRDAGSAEPWMQDAGDFDGDPRLDGLPDIGADEYVSGAQTGSLTVAIVDAGPQVNTFVPVTFRGQFTGKVRGFHWDMGAGPTAVDQLLVAQTYNATGTWRVLLIASNDQMVVTGALDVVVVPGGRLRWAGNATNVQWKTGQVSNWYDTVTSQSCAFAQGDNVLFTDTGAMQPVDCGGVSPSWVTFWPVAQSYHVSGTISGGNRFTKMGPNVLSTGTISFNYTGETHIVEGVLQLYKSFNNLLGTTNVPTYIHRGAALDFPRLPYVGAQTWYLLEPLLIAGAGPDGRGAVVNDFTNDNVHGYVRLSSIGLLEDAALGGAGRLDLGGKVALNGHTLTKTASNVIYQWNTMYGPGSLVITQGTYGLGTGSLLTSGVVTRVGSGGRLWFWSHDATNDLVVVDGGVVGLQEVNPQFSCHEYGPFVLSNIAYFASYSASNLCTLHLHGPVSGPGRLVKIGDSFLRLIGTNTYTGGTEVREGTIKGTTYGLTGLITNYGVVEIGQLSTGVLTATISSTGVVTFAGPGLIVVPSIQPYTGPTLVSEGTLQVDGMLADGTVSVMRVGCLAGTGTVGGTVVNRGTVAPGSPIGRLALARNFQSDTGGVLRIEVAVAGHDWLDVAGSAKLAGTLRADTVGGFDPSPGSEFVVLRAASITGAFHSVAGTPHPGTGWQVIYSPTSVTMVVTGVPVYGFDAYVFGVTNENLRGYGDDPDGDGFPNLLEYATAANAAGTDAVSRLVGGIATGLEPVIWFPARPGATDVSYFVEWAAHPAAEGWSVMLSNPAGMGWAGLAPFVIVPGTGSDQVVAETLPATQSNSVFRLRVTRP